LKTTGSGRQSLKQYELKTLRFFLTLIAALAIVVASVFYFLTRTPAPQEASGGGVLSASLDSASDMGAFNLGTKLSETTIQCHNRLEIPVTDDGLLRDLFAIPGVNEVTVNQTMIIVWKANDVRWQAIDPSVRRIVKNHLHLHY
jgi:hypothetical protein